MKSEWKVTRNTINGRDMYGVYRLIDKDAVDHSGNREYSGGYVEFREEAALTAALLNRTENHAA